MTSEYPQTTGFDLAGLWGVESAKRVLLVLVAAGESDSEIPLRLLSGLAGWLNFFSQLRLEKRRRPHNFPLTKTHGS